MPNHVHGIIIINKINDDRNPVAAQNFAQPQLSPTKKPVPANQFGPQSQNLASIIRGYKTGVKKYATMNNIDFVWQSRFYDHIIRNNESFMRIETYIENNPRKWNKDKFNGK